jgi:hypothetical protein
MRLALAVNGKTRSIASLRGPGFLNDHVNMSDRPKEHERANQARIHASHTLETQTISMHWPTVELQVGDTVEIRILPDGDGDTPSEIRKLGDSPSNLLSDSGLAKELLGVVSEFEKRIAGFLEKAEKVESAEEYRKVKLAAAHVLAEVGEQLLFPVFRRHKELIPEESKGELL